MQMRLVDCSARLAGNAAELSSPSMASSSRGRSSSPFGFRKPSSPYSSSSTSSMNGRSVPRSSSSAASAQFCSPANAFIPRSVTPNRVRTDSGLYSRVQVPRGPGVFPEPVLSESVDGSRSGDSISVTVRFRPLSEREFQRGDEIAWYPEGDKLVRCEYNPATGYAFDRVFGPSMTSKAVYDVAARPVVKAAMEGINGTVFAYGVTSSGKTYTMHGDQDSPGIIPLAIKDVFGMIQDTPGREFLLRVSYLEIYNEVINDLLDPTGQNLRVREDAHGTYVEGIKEEVVLSPGHVLSFIAAGEEHRHVGSNNFNLLSSRSHTIFTLMIESSAHGDEYDGVIFSQLNLIDLAGSESSKTETTGLRRKEGAYINKSLLTLGTVIGKLSEGRASHIPYRDSKLTRLLQSSLSGHGHVSLICTITPASSNLEETHNTLKFASRAKQVEICASRNKIIDERSLIKKYQNEISSLKQELEQLKKGMLVGVSHEELISLKQKLAEGQVKMQSRLEEEEEAKVALMSRIQRLTKLILVSTKNTIPSIFSDVPGHHRRHSLGEDDRLEMFREGSPLLHEGENLQKDFQHSGTLISSSSHGDVKQRRSSSKVADDQAPLSSPVELNQAGELITRTVSSTGITMSDQMDLLVEQVKMLAGEIAFSTSTLKRLLEQSANNPGTPHVQKLEAEIEEKRKQMRALEQRIMESGEASIANASLVEMQQRVMRLMAQCNEKSFELEIKTADNRILQEQLQNKCMENKELQEKVEQLQEQLASIISDKSTFSPDHCVSEDYVEELRRKMLPQDFVNENLMIERAQLVDENSGLRAQNQKLAEEASYAKELASAAAVELKNLASEVTKLSLQNERQAKELLTVQELMHSKGVHLQAGNGVLKKYAENRSDTIKHVRRSCFNNRGNDGLNSAYDDSEYWRVSTDDLAMELHARKQREAALEAALAEKELAEGEYRKQIEDAKKKERDLENDLAGMWILVAKLKKGDQATMDGLTDHDKLCYQADSQNDLNFGISEDKDAVIRIREATDRSISSGPDVLLPTTVVPPLVAQLKTRVQEMKEREYQSTGNAVADSHICKVCFEVPTASVLIPCRHFCLCKPCSLACSECPLCRQKIDDRIFTFS